MAFFFPGLMALHFLLLLELPLFILGECLAEQMLKVQKVNRISVPEMLV
jgi:hypothetical protein